MLWSTSFWNITATWNPYIFCELFKTYSGGKKRKVFWCGNVAVVVLHRKAEKPSQGLVLYSAACMSYPWCAVTEDSSHGAAQQPLGLFSILLTFDFVFSLEGLELNTWSLGFCLVLIHTVFNECCFCPSVFSELGKLLKLLSYLKKLVFVINEENENKS